MILPMANSPQHTALHSHRSAVVGSTRVARRAGKYTATIPVQRQDGGRAEISPRIQRTQPVQRAAEDRARAKGAGKADRQANGERASTRHDDKRD